LKNNVAATLRSVKKPKSPDPLGQVTLDTQVKKRQSAARRSTPSVDSETTREKITRCAREGFNRDGYQSVSTKQIAASLNISPGNLTYHFQRKPDLLRAVIDQFENELFSLINIFPYDKGADETYETEATALASILKKLFEVLWDNRFLFKETGYILTESKDVLPRLQHMRMTVISLLLRHFEAGFKSGSMQRVKAPASELILAENIWIQWTGWLSQEASYRVKGRKIDTKAIIYNCCIHYLCLVQPYLDPDYVIELHKVIEHQFKPTKRKNKSA
jgi:AcrR family transcriptional regulator